METNNNEFVSLGQQLRTLLKPYEEQTEMINKMREAEQKGDTETFNNIKEKLYDTPTENLNDINTFSFIEQLEKINYKTTKLYMMEQMLKKMTRQQDFTK